MHSTYYQETFPKQLESELATTWATSTFTRRTCVVFDEVAKAWALFGCVMKPQTGEAAGEREVFDFGRVMLLSDSLPASEVGPFLTNTQEHVSRLSGRPVRLEMYQQCTRHSVTLQNYWMFLPGAVYTWGATAQPTPPSMQLLSVSAPYYPDVTEAALDWLQLGGRAGRADVDKGQVALLLPETRAFFSGHSWAQDDEHLQLDVNGSVVGSERVVIKGAYWCDKVLRHLHVSVDGNTATLKIAREADRLHLNLLSEGGTVFEQHQEDLRYAGEKRFLGTRHRMSADRVSKALKDGEGPHIEFKPFVLLPGHKTKLTGGSRDKLDEVLQTVAAFSNADGGTIFLGVSNDVQVVGVSRGLTEATGSKVDRAAVQRYADGLRAHLRDEMYLPVDIDVSVHEHEKELLVLVEVPASRTKLVSLKKDSRLLRRHGASNKAVPPEEWTPREREFFHL